MKNYWALIFLFALSTVNAQSISEIDKVIGKYQFCPFHCISIEINPDSTFYMEFNGDLYSGENATGKIIPLGSNIFLVNTFIQPFTPEEYFVNNDYILIKIVDQENTSLGAANVWINDMDSSYVCDDKGELILPKDNIYKVKVSFIGSVLNYEIQKTISDSILIKHYNNPGKLIITDEKWIIRNDSLFMPGTVGIKKVNN